MNGSRSRAPLLILLAACLGLGIAGCGDSDDSDQTSAGGAEQGLTKRLTGAEREAAATVAEYLSAYEAGDGDRVCGLTSRDDAALEDCKSTLADALEPSELPRFEVESIRATGDRATIRLTSPKRDDTTFFKLQRFDGEWKILVVGLG